MKIKRIDHIRTVNVSAIVVLSIVLYYIFSEIVITLLNPKNIYNEFEYYASKVFSEEEWLKAEKFREDLIKIGSRGILIKDSIVYHYKPASTETVKFNSSGFRGKEIEKKVPGEFRVAIFGASRIWGNYYQDKDTIPVMIENKLKKILPDKKISVINMSVEGNDLQRGVETAKMFFDAVQFDLTLFYFGYTDMNYSYLHGNKTWEPFSSDSPMDEETFNDFIRSAYPRSWFKTTKIYNLVWQSIKGEFTGFALNKTEFNSNGEISEFQNNTAKEFHKIFFNRIEETAQYFNNLNVTTVLILPPVPQTKEPLSELETKMITGYELLAPGYNRYISKCTENVLKIMKEKPKSFTFIDHSDIFDGNSETIFYDGMHMTPNGSAKTSEMIARFLSDFIKKMP